MSRYVRVCVAGRGGVLEIVEIWINVHFRSEGLEFLGTEEGVEWRLNILKNRNVRGYPLGPLGSQVRKGRF